MNQLIIKTDKSRFLSTCQQRYKVSELQETFTKEEVFFPIIAKDANISAPNRMLTRLHVNNCHWVFDKRLPTTT